jgi:cobalt-zinc-cadmium efflux system protein
MAQPHSHSTTANIRVAFFLNLAFTLIEVVGGFWTNSLAILSDAMHDLGDSLSLGLAWYMERLSHEGGSSRYSYGYRRFSLLAAFINAVVLIVGSLFILSAAIPRLLHPQHSNAGGMAVLALVGITANGLAVFRLQGGKTLNAQIIAWHLLEDVLGWIAVLIVSVSLMFLDIHILDPLLSVLITGYVLYNVLRNLRKTVALFLQAAPADVDVHAIEHELACIPGVLSTHHTHAWSLDGEHHVLTTHLVVPAEATKEDLLSVKRQVFRLMEQIDLEHTTVEIEYEDEDCRMRDD